MPAPNEGLSAPEERQKRPGRTAQMAVPTTIATVVATMGNYVVDDYRMAGREATWRADILDRVELRYVSKETSENRSAMLASEISDIGRAVQDIKESIRGIPRIEAKLEVLEEQVRNK
jgi:hypothetical protein